MRTTSNILLKKINSNNVRGKEVLPNVREGLGKVAHYKGNPLSKTEIMLQIRTTFWDLTGGAPVIIAPAGLPLAFQNPLPVYLFGLTDYYSGFVKSRSIIGNNPVWIGQNVPAAFTNIAIIGKDIPNAYVWDVNAVTGDLYIGLADNVVFLANYYCEIIIHCDNVAYGTFLNSFVSDLITLEMLRYIVPIANINQFINPIIFGTQSLFGKTHTDNIDPRVYITSRDFQQQIADIPLHLPIDKSLMMGFQLDVFCQNVSFVLFVEKVEALTHKQSLT